MGKQAPQAPAAPDPFATAKAQTGSNIGTAIANSWLGNANENSPLGSVGYTQSGSHQVNDGQGNIFDVPSFTRNVTLSPEEQAKLAQSQQIQLGMLGLGQSQLGSLNRALGGSIDDFDASYYLQNNPDVAKAAAQSPMRDISFFDEKAYLAANPDVAANVSADGPGSFKSGLEHWQAVGQSEGRTGSGLQDPNAFAQWHWQNAGQTEGRLQNDLPQAVNDISQWLPMLQEFGGNIPQLLEVGGNQRPDLLEAEGRPDLLEVGQQRPDLLEYGTQDFGASRQAVEDALYARLNPQLERDKAALDVQLTNEGFTRGSEAYNRAMDEFTRQANDARLGVVREGGAEESRLAQLRMAQIQLDNASRTGEYDQLLQQISADNAARTGEYGMGLQGVATTNNARLGEWGALMEQINADNAARQGNFANRMGALQNDNAIRQAGFGNRLQSATFANTSRERALQEQLLKRQTPLNEASAILSGGQVNMPQFSPYQGGNVAGTPLGDYVYRGFDTQSKNWQAQQQAAAQQNAAMFGAGANLLGGLFKMSDRRVKRDVVRIGELRDGIGLYRYRYNWSDEIELGVMADEVEAVMPEAVVTRGGVALVDYGAFA